MKAGKATMLVARWEFLRYVKLRQQIIGMVITFAVGLVTVGVMRLADGGEPEVMRVAVIGGEVLPVTAPPDAEYVLVQRPASEEAALRSSIGEEFHGLLIISSRDRAELTVKKRGDWTGAVHAGLTAARQQLAMEELGVQPAALAAALQPPQMEVKVEGSAGPTRSKLNRVTMFVVLGVMLMSIFLGMGYIFASITGEKQIRVTEQIISAIPAQSWIDGKILGLIGVSMVTVLNTAIASAALMAVVFVATGPSLNISLPAGAPLTVLTIVLFGVLGLFFWFAFLGVVAAMIDDPHDSSRGSLLMVPLAATTLAFLVGKNPDGGFARVLSLFPATSPSAMPARMIVSDVQSWEIALSLLLLIGGVALLRTAAGRVFRVAMLMYGKEPTWSEVRRWAFAGSAAEDPAS